jgi:RNA polymerase sigma-70 factor (ECF subfamily)
MSAQRALNRTREIDLLRAVAEGDLSALGVLYDSYAEHVRRFVVRATGRSDVADDVTHEAFLALVDSAARYDARYSARSFLIGIAGKLVLRRKRRLAIRLRVLAEMTGIVARVDQHTPERAAAADEELARYQAALARLSDAKRVAVVMADVEGMSGAEIAQQLGIPVGTVATRVHHARAELRRALRREGSS